MDLDEYPNFLGCFQNDTPNTYSPQVVLLHEMLGSSITKATVKVEYDKFMTQFAKDIMGKVANSTDAFKYGAEYDSLNASDIVYGVVGDGKTYYDPDGNLVDTGTFIAYPGARIVDADTGDLRKIKNRDFVLGVSHMQYEVDTGQREDPNRIFYLNPAEYGNTYKRPPIYVAPVKHSGWLAFAEATFPDISTCPSDSLELVDFAQIQKIIDDIYPNMPEDMRLKNDSDCIVELPYDRVLERASAAGLHGLIIAAIRIYVSSHLIKSMATMSVFEPKFPEVYSSLYAAYIVEAMEDSFKDAQGSFLEFFNTFKDQEFWYAFLEQSVQMYSNMVEEDKIRPPPSVLEALMRLNDMQESYEEDYPTKETLKEAKKVNDAGEFQTLKGYRQDKVLEEVRNTEDDAKLILKELVIRE
jgi:hypothetical protein